MTTPFILIKEWEDTEGHELINEKHPDWGYQWPYPTQYKESLIVGNLRDSIVKLFDIPYKDFQLVLLETIISSGYSEFTQEEEFNMKLLIRKGSSEKTLWDSEKQTGFWLGYDSSSNLAKFIDLFAPKENN